MTGSSGEAAADVECVLNHLCGLGNCAHAAGTRVRDIARAARQHVAGAELMDEGGHGPCRYIVSGWACWRLDLADGRRQIFGFLLPGDRIGSQALGAGSVFAITPVETVDAITIWAAANRFNPSPATVAQAPFAIGQAALLDQIVRLGQLTAYERVANMFLDLRRRLSAVGLSVDRGFQFPLTQECLAASLGLSPVHLNRTLQRMRKEKLIALRSSILSILRPDALAAIGDCLEWVAPTPGQPAAASAERPMGYAGRREDGQGAPA